MKRRILYIDPLPVCILIMIAIEVYFVFKVIL